MKSSNIKLYLKFWWPFYLFALLFIATTISAFFIKFEDNTTSLFICMDLLFLAASVGMLTHRVSLISDVKSGLVVCNGDEDVELDNVLRKIYFEYLTGHKYESEETNR